MVRFMPLNRLELRNAVDEVCLGSTGIHTEYGHINDWDVSRVTDMYMMFANKKSFNQPLCNWNVSNVTDMDSMFVKCKDFNQPLNHWNVSNVTDMDSMFFNCESFNQPLNHWNVSNVTMIRQIFSGCRAFHQVLPWEIRVSAYTYGMFYGSHGSLLVRRSPGTIRRRNMWLAHSIIKRSNHPNMMRIDDGHVSPIEPDHPDFPKRFMANVRKTSPELLGSTTRRKRSRSRYLAAIKNNSYLDEV